MPGCDDTELATWTVYARTWIPRARWHLAIGIPLVVIPVALWMAALVVSEGRAWGIILWVLPPSAGGIELIRRVYRGAATTFLSPGSFDLGDRKVETTGQLYWEPYAGPGQWQVYREGLRLHAEVRHRGAWRLFGLIDYPHKFVACLPYERIRTYRTKAKGAATVIILDYGHVEGHLYPLEFTMARDGEPAFQSFERALNQSRQQRQA